MTTANCHAARTGEGYWTCDVPGGCGDCRTLAVEIEDRAQIAAWDAERNPPTVIEHYDGPDAPRCPDCGQYPDRYRATCLTCLRGERG